MTYRSLGVQLVAALAGCSGASKGGGDHGDVDSGAHDGDLQDGDPADPSWIDVTSFGAVGDGVTDDTASPWLSRSP